MERLRELLQPIVDAAAPYAAWLVGGSILAMIVTPFLVTWLITRIPSGYFLQRRAPLGGWRRTHPVLRWGGLLAKNLTGLVLVLAGLVMFVTPGQGILTTVAGIVMLDFPGKRRLQLWLLRKPKVLGALNAIRARRGRPPLELPPRGARRQASPRPRSPR